MELLTVQEAAELLKVSSITIRRFVAAGRLPAVKVGKGVRVRREAVDHLMQPVEPRSLPAHKAFSQEDSLWNIVGLARSEGADDVSENKHRYLAEANQ